MSSATQENKEDKYITKEELNNHINQLIDKDGDGIISRSELESYVKSSLMDHQTEIDKWKNAYEELKIKYDDLISSSDKTESRDGIIVSRVSIENLKKYIEDEIISTDANLKLVPDSLERKIYLSVYKTVMKSIEKLFNTTTIDLMNHRITFTMVPKDFVCPKGTLRNIDKKD